MNQPLKVTDAYIPFDLQLLLDEVQEDEIVDVLIDTNEIGMLLNAIAADNETEIKSALDMLKMKASVIRMEKATKILDDRSHMS